VLACEEGSLDEGWLGGDWETAVANRQVVDVSTKSKTCSYQIMTPFKSSRFRRSAYPFPSPLSSLYRSTSVRFFERDLAEAILREYMATSLTCGLLWIAGRCSSCAKSPIMREECQHTNNAVPERVGMVRLSQAKERNIDAPLPMRATPAVFIAITFAMRL